MLTGVAQQATVPWMDIIIVGGALIGAFGAFIAFPMYVFFLKDRQKVLLRQEVSDEARRRQQLEEALAERTKERDALRDALADERKKPDVTGLAVTLAGIADTGLKTLDKLSEMNGSIAHAVDRMDASTRAMETQTEAVKFLASQVVVHDPKGDKPTWSN